MENHNGWKRTFLVINKRVGPEFIIEQLEREGSWGKYDLVRPTGPVPGDTDRYLQFQHLYASLTKSGHTLGVSLRPSSTVVLGVRSLETTSSNSTSRPGRPRV